MCAALFALLVPFIAATPAFAQAAQQRQVGSWVLKWARAQIGYYCTVESVQGGRTLGYQVVADGRMFFGLKNPAWTWQPRSVLDAKLSLAGGPQWSGKAIAPLPDVLVFPIRQEPGSDPARAMEASRSLAFEVEGSSITFDLADFTTAARAQRDCLANPS